MSEADVRQRHVNGTHLEKRTLTASTKDVGDQVEDAGPVISILDVLRIILTLCVASCALSYYITSGESVLWGYRPWVTRPQELKAYFVCHILLLYTMVDVAIW